MHVMYRHNTKTLLNCPNTYVDIWQQDCIYNCKELISTSLGLGGGWQCKLNSTLISFFVSPHDKLLLFFYGIATLQNADPTDVLVLNLAM